MDMTHRAPDARLNLVAPALPGASARRLRDIAYLVAANLFKLALGVVTSALIFRALGPTDAGRLTLALSIVGLLSIVGEFGLRDAAVNYIARFQESAPERAQAIARTFLLARVILAALASAVGILAAGVIAGRFYPEANAAGLIQLGSFSLFTGGLLAFALVVLEARQQFKAISAIGILQAVVRAVLVVLLFGVRELNLVSLLAVEALVPLLVLFYSLRLLPRPFLKLPPPWFAELGTLFHFTKWIAVAAFASAIFLKLDVLVSGYYRAPAELGLYAVALALVGRLDVVKNAIVTTAFPDACRRGTRAELLGFVRQSLGLTAGATLVFMPLFLLGGTVIEWLYGAAYREATLVFNVLLAAYLIGLNVAPVAFVLYPLNRPRWIAAIDLIQLAFSLAVSLALIPSFGIAGAACAVLLTRVLYAAITCTLVWKLLAVDRWQAL